ncbi:translation initiation factor IF-2 subunit beta [Candidatus Woesearchaeota archaeon]|nr:translation initiation factor IF-2 subunit beta [Candidatus Woesearchaeota archaeon]
MDYKKLLKKARDELPDTVIEKERFEIPKARGHVQGNKTIITNFNQIIDTLHREPNHLIKFLTKELAAPAQTNGNMLIIGAKVSASMVNEKISKYAKEYVLCFECGKPDTKIIVENNATFLRCLACGAKYAIKSKI